MRPKPLRRLRHLWFVYQFGKLDFIATTLEQAEEMAETPEGDKKPYNIERWRLLGNTYIFEERIR